MKFHFPLTIEMPEGFGPVTSDSEASRLAAYEHLANQVEFSIANDLPTGSIVKVGQPYLVGDSLSGVWKEPKSARPWLMRKLIFGVFTPLDVVLLVGGFGLGRLYVLMSLKP